MLKWPTPHIHGFRLLFLLNNYKPNCIDLSDNILIKYTGVQGELILLQDTVFMHLVANMLWIYVKQSKTCHLFLSKPSFPWLCLLTQTYPDSFWLGWLETTRFGNKGDLSLHWFYPVFIIIIKSFLPFLSLWASSFVYWALTRDQSSFTSL